MFYKYFFFFKIRFKHKKNLKRLNPTKNMNHVLFNLCRVFLNYNKTFKKTGFVGITRNVQGLQKIIEKEINYFLSFRVN